MLFRNIPCDGFFSPHFFKGALCFLVIAPNVRIWEFDRRLRAFEAREKIFYKLEGLNLDRFFFFEIIISKCCWNIFRRERKIFAKIRNLTKFRQSRSTRIASRYSSEFKRASSKYKRSGFWNRISRKKIISLWFSCSFVIIPVINLHFIYLFIMIIIIFFRKAHHYHLIFLAGVRLWTLDRRWRAFGARRNIISKYTEIETRSLIRGQLYVYAYGIYDDGKNNFYEK